MDAGIVSGMAARQAARPASIRAKGGAVFLFLLVNGGTDSNQFTVRKAFYGPLHRGRHRSHLLRQFTTKAFAGWPSGIRPPHEEMEHVLKVAVPQLFQAVSSKEQLSPIVVPAAVSQPRKPWSTPYEKLIAVSTTAVFCSPGSWTRSPPETWSALSALFLGPRILLRSNAETAFLLIGTWYLALVRESTI